MEIIQLRVTFDAACPLCVALVRVVRHMPSDPPIAWAGGADTDHLRVDIHHADLWVLEQHGPRAMWTLGLALRPTRWFFQWAHRMDLAPILDVGYGWLTRHRRALARGLVGLRVLPQAGTPS